MGLNILRSYLFWKHALTVWKLPSTVMLIIAVNVLSLTPFFLAETLPLHDPAMLPDDEDFSFLFSRPEAFDFLIFLLLQTDTCGSADVNGHHKDAFLYSLHDMDVGPYIL